MNTQLTIRQELALNSINIFIGEFGFPPTHVELAEMMKIANPKAASDHLWALDRKGYIKIYTGISRGIKVLTKDNQ